MPSLARKRTGSESPGNLSTVTQMHVKTPTAGLSLPPTGTLYLSLPLLKISLLREREHEWGKGQRERSFKQTAH